MWRIEANDPAARSCGLPFSPVPLGGGAFLSLCMANYPEMSKAAHRLLRELWNSQPTTLICVPVKDVAKGVRMKEDVVCEALGELAAEGILEGRIERGQAVYRVLVFPRRDTDS